MGKEGFEALAYALREMRGKMPVWQASAKVGVSPKSWEAWEAARGLGPSKANVGGIVEAFGLDADAEGLLWGLARAMWRERAARARKKRKIAKPNDPHTCKRCGAEKRRRDFRFDPRQPKTVVSVCLACEEASAQLTRAMNGTELVNGRWRRPVLAAGRV